MLHRLRHLGRWLDAADVGGWLMIYGGLGLIGLTLLTPAWLDLRHVAHDRRRVQAHWQQLRDQHLRYAAFLDAARSDDPLLLQRLAWWELNLKPAGVEPLLPPQLAKGRLGSFQQMLAAPTESPPTDTRANDPPASRLVRWTTGPHRPILLVAGAVLIGLGLISNLDPRDPGDPGTAGRDADPDADDGDTARGLD